MILSIYIYLIMAFFTIGFSYVGTKNKQFKYVLIGLGCYAITMGLRYNVGIDYLAYYEMFRNASNGIILIDLYRTEFGFKQITIGIAYLSSSPFVYFSCIAFIQVFFYFLILKNKSQTWVFIAFSFITMCIWLNFANTLRQFIAASIIIYSLIFICEKRLIKFLICIFLATLFHKAALIFIVLYPIFRFRFQSLINKYYAIIILLVSVLLSNINIINNYLSLFESVATMLNYDGYLNGDASVYMDVKVNKGFGFYLLFVMNLTIVWYSEKIVEYYHDRLITILYYLFLFGTSLGYITLLNQMFSRLTLFISSCNFILYGLVLCYVNKNNKKNFYTLLLPPVILFLGTIIKADLQTDGSAYFRLIFDYT